MIDTKQYDPYSPKAIDEIVGNTETWKMLEKLINENKASHLILTGPAGCGKSLFLKLILSAFPTLFIDCTANSGLRDVRDNIRIFARGNRSPNGNLRWSRSCINNIFNGEDKCYYENGVLHISTTVLNNEYDGEYIFYHDDGQICGIIMFKNGKIVDGEYKKFYKNEIRAK